MALGVRDRSNDWFWHLAMVCCFAAFLPLLNELRNELAGAGTTALDPSETLAAKFAVMHKAASAPDVIASGRRRLGKREGP
jgi:hypothetical protein